MTEELSTQSFPKALKVLLEERDISQRELSRRTKRHGFGHLSTINGLARGDIAPSINAISQVAQTLQVRPEYFAEYRLAKARNALDPQIVGLDTALEHGLEAAEQALAGK